MRLFLLGGLGSLFANFSKLGPDRSEKKKKSLRNTGKCGQPCNIDLWN